MITHKMEARWLSSDETEDRRKLGDGRPLRTVGDAELQARWRARRKKGQTRRGEEGW